MEAYSYSPNSTQVKFKKLIVSTIHWGSEIVNVKQIIISQYNSCSKTHHQETQPSLYSDNDVFIKRIILIILYFIPSTSRICLRLWYFSAWCESGIFSAVLPPSDQPFSRYRKEPRFFLMFSLFSTAFSEILVRVLS